MKVIPRSKFFLSSRHGFSYFVADRRVRQSSFSIIAGATLTRSPLTRTTQESRLRAFRRTRRKERYRTSDRLVNGSSQLFSVTQILSGCSRYSSAEVTRFRIGEAPQSYRALAEPSGHCEHGDAGFICIGRAAFQRRAANCTSRASGQRHHERSTHLKTHTRFGGVPEELLFDQMRAVVLSDDRAVGGGLVLNAEFLRFAPRNGGSCRVPAVPIVR